MKVKVGLVSYDLTELCCSCFDCSDFKQEVGNLLLLGKYAMKPFGFNFRWNSNELEFMYCTQ